MQYYINRNQHQLGPFTDVEIKTKLASGEFAISDPVWWEGQKEWVPLAQSGLAPLSPPVVPSPDVITKKTSPLAITAISLAFVGLLFAPLQIGTVIIGHLAIGEIKKKPNLKGRGMAITSLVIGYIYISIIAVCVIIAVSNQIWHWAG